MKQIDWRHIEVGTQWALVEKLERRPMVGFDLMY